MLSHAPARPSLLSSRGHIGLLPCPEDPGCSSRAVGHRSPGWRNGPAPLTLCLYPPPLALAPEPSDPRGREHLRLLQQLHQSSQQLWEVTEESLHSLRERLCHQDSVGLESLLLLCGADRVLQVHVE